MDLYNFLKKRDDITLDEVIFNSILDGLLKTGKYDEALEIYNDMKKANVRRSNATFSILIKIYSKQDNVDKAIEVYKEMISEKMKPSLITYTSILQILIKKKKIQFGIDIFDEIIKNKLKPDQVMFNVIINGCVFNGRLEDACRFLFESFKANIRLCNDVYKNIFCNLLTNRVMETSYKNDLTLKICKELKSRNLEIDYDLYCKVIKMCYRSYGKNADKFIQKELDEYKSSILKSSNDNQEKNNYHNKHKYNSNGNYHSYNGYKQYNGFNKGANYNK